MRIVLVDTTISGELIGGAQTFLVGLMRELGDLGHEVHLLADGVPNERAGASIHDSGATVHTDVADGSRLVEDTTPVVAKWVNGLRPDVFVGSVSPDIGWAVLPMLDPNIATLTIGHNDEETFYTPVRHYRRFLTGAIGVSKEICRKFREDCGMPAKHVMWIPYGVEVLGQEPTGLTDGPMRLLYVGRLDEQQKRISDVVKIAKRLGESDLRFTLDIFGDGDERSLVERELAGMIADGRVRMHGWVTSDEVIGAMREAEIFLLSSAYEGFCISLTEAMANGCCPVVTDIDSGNKQLVEDGVNGFVVPVGYVEGFVDRIGVLAGDRDRLLAMRQAAWYTGKQYGVERMVQNYEDCFRSSIEETRRNPRTPDPSFPLMESCRSKYPLWLRRIKAKAKSIVDRN